MVALRRGCSCKDSPAWKGQFLGPNFRSDSKNAMRKARRIILTPAVDTYVDFSSCLLTVVLNYI